MALWVSMQLVLVLQILLQENSALCHRAKHMCGPGVRATKRKVGRWQVQLLLPPNEVSSLSATVPMGYRMADASFQPLQIPKVSLKPSL